MNLTQAANHFKVTEEVLVNLLIKNNIDLRDGEKLTPEQVKKLSNSLPKEVEVMALPSSQPKPVTPNAIAANSNGVQGGASALAQKQAESDQRALLQGVQAGKRRVKTRVEAQLKTESKLTEQFYGMLKDSDEAILEESGRIYDKGASLEDLIDSEVEDFLGWIA